MKIKSPEILGMKKKKKPTNSKSGEQAKGK